MIKRVAAALMAVILLVVFTGCTRVPYSSEASEIPALPEPPEEAVNMILGERIASKPENITLYYVSGDGSAFTTVMRSFAVSFGENKYADAVELLLGSASMPNRISFLPKELQLLDVEYSSGIATVNLSLDAYSIEDEQEMLMLLATISNSLLSMEDVQAVNILIDGRAVSISNLPVGAQTDLFTGIAPAYAQMNAEQEYFLESSASVIERNAVLYFPSSEDDWFVPEARAVTLHSTDYASALIRALRDGPVDTGCTMSVIPEGADLLLNNPVIGVHSSGKRVLYLEFSPTLRNYLAFSGMDEWKFVGSIALTLCSFSPWIDAISICIGDEAVTECELGEETIVFADGLIEREVFSRYIGSAVTLFLPNENGTLNAVERAVNLNSAQSPQGLLHALLDASLAWDGVVSGFPANVYYNDILGISVENGIASVNLSGNFYRQSQVLDAATERGVIYAMVNTLCRLNDIQGVRFYIEGIAAETLSGNIYLKGVLLPNPGLVSQ